MGVDDEVHLRTQPVSTGVNPSLTGRLVLSPISAVRDIHQHQLVLPQRFVSQSAGGDQKLTFGYPDADIAPGAGGEPLRSQMRRRLQDLFPSPGFHSGHVLPPSGAQLASTRSNRESTSSIISSV